MGVDFHQRADQYRVGHRACRSRSAPSSAMRRPAHAQAVGERHDADRRRLAGPRQSREGWSAVDPDALSATPGSRNTRAGAASAIVRTWLGFEANLPDMMPLVGPMPGIPDAFVIGCVRGGYTIGPYMGELLSQLILGREPEMPLFNPARFNTASADQRLAS
jgi:hypothetical protein